jgi:ATP-dependent DNA ligase
MNRFAALLDRLAYEGGRNNKLRLLSDYFATTADPDRGYALAAITGALSFRHAKPGLIRALIAERTDPTLFALSYDYVGDLSETVALMWPVSAHDHPLPRLRGRVGEGAHPTALTRGERPLPTPPPQAGEGKKEPAFANRGPTLSEVITTLGALGKADLPAQLAQWLDDLDEVGRWALLKLVTGALRIGVSARLAKTAVAALGDRDVDEIEIIWPSLKPPYGDLFAWLEGRAGKPESGDPAPFRPPMLSHAIAEADFAALDPAEFLAEWKWDGIRVQAVAGLRPDGHILKRLFSRSGEDISASFPDLVESFAFEGALDGELLIMRDGRVQSFNVLQQRLNRKTVTAKLTAEFPAHLRAYDLLVDGAADLRGETFAVRRARLEAFVARLDPARIDLSPLVPFATWEELAAARADPAAAGAGPDAQAVEGVVIKRRDASYLPGRPKGPWWKWKRDPFVVDAVLMYAQRGHGKRSSFYSDYTFGVWTAGPAGEELAPVGKAYFGFTDAELAEIDRFVRNNTVNRFGPAREVVHTHDRGLVFEVAFEGLQRSTRHRSGIAMRFPRISRLRWDKHPRDADRLETLEALLDRGREGGDSAPRRRARKIAVADVLK